MVVDVVVDIGIVAVDMVHSHPPGIGTWARVLVQRVLDT